ncbi:DUF4244 domain-containing protein [Actinomyces trachealis]|uniref:DUF4244 domain-containing protein n=1 Tax=Actinomyces trachealis TaxID=2763540 RepID=UPI001892CF69|nr:DUF4244 domain-containing protein [Actinomyces trachealis]
MNRILHTLRVSLALTRGAPTPGRLVGEVDPTDPDDEAGMATAEYAVGTLAAAAFAGLLLSIMRGGGPTALLSSLINSALSNP